MWISPEDHKVIGAFLSAIRQEAGVTQDELSRRLKKPQSFISSYERGQRRIDFLEFTHVMIALERDPRKVAAALMKELVAHVEAGRGTGPA